jgi:hypothetical protein
MNEVTSIDPIQILVDEAIEVLTADDPMWPKGAQEHKGQLIEDLKERSLRRVTYPNYFIFSMIVNHKILICHAPLSTNFDTDYNPFR